AWWELGDKTRVKVEEKTRLKTAATYWYDRALPKLTGLELAKAQQRTAEDGQGSSAGAVRPLQLAMGGLAGLATLSPEKTSGNVSPAGGFATLAGKADIEYPAIPVGSYIHDLELTFLRPAGRFNVNYGSDSYDRVALTLNWDDKEKEVAAHLFRCHGGMTYWSGRRSYDVGQKVNLTMYTNVTKYWLYQDGSRVLGSENHPRDFRLRLDASEDGNIVISRCAIRKWTEADAQFVGCPMPPDQIDCDVVRTAVRLHQRNLQTTDRPAPNAPQPFVVGSSGTAMQWIPPGSFQRTYSDAAKPATKVDISHGFWIARYETTQGEWAGLMPLGASRSHGSPFLPVDAVTWQDAVNFCKLLNQQEQRLRRLPQGYEYRLPTEAEWEYACRSGATDDFSVDPDGFWSSDNSGRTPHEVGTGLPNKAGLYDMHGNVPEWCCDAWSEEPDAPPPQLVDPITYPKSPKDHLVARGGAWWASRKDCSSKSRFHNGGAVGAHHGFRVVLGPTLRGG
ncbi:MAG TPA: formylglycine-generating enzyme family protein, partial [Thermoguttaceae bacterium]|nr:formylglycine-generating enzyme family protein [Thermoguttaceae bacterium]